MGIVFWTSVFGAKVIETGYSKNELIIFGIATGAATFIFMGSAAVIFSFIGGIVPVILVQILNGIVGALLIGYGTLRLVKLLSNKK